MNWAQFMDKWRNVGADYDGWYGDQCVDLFNYYNRDVVGAPFIWCNYASELWDNAMGAAPGHYEKIVNGPDNAPEPGDVVIWRGNGTHTGPAGHVAIATGRTDGPYHFQTFDQNWPTGSLPHEQWHDYFDVIGWLRPVSAAQASPQPDTETVPETPAPVEQSQPDVEPTPPVAADEPQAPSSTDVESVPVTSPDPSSDSPDEPAQGPEQSPPSPEEPKTPSSETDSSPLTPPVVTSHNEGMGNILLQKLTSRKFLLALAALLTLAANHQWTEFVATLGLYVGAEGWVDASR